MVMHKFWQKLERATFWANFSQTHLVTLVANLSTLCMRENTRQLDMAFSFTYDGSFSPTIKTAAVGCTDTPYFI
jgi:hypothetical protein